jgi:hypothetical protein
LYVHGFYAKIDTICPLLSKSELYWKYSDKGISKQIVKSNLHDKRTGYKDTPVSLSENIIYPDE